MERDSRTGKYTGAVIEWGPDGVRNENGRLVGQIWSTPYSWFAGPHGSQIQAIPCDSREDATDTVLRLGEPC